jgi:hypothetical protein
MSAWTKFATQFFHNKQKQNPDYKFSQALKEASKVYKKNKGGSSKKQRGGRPDGKKKTVNGVEVDCDEDDEDEQCKEQQDVITASTDEVNSDKLKPMDDITSNPAENNLDDMTTKTNAASASAVEAARIEGSEIDAAKGNPNMPPANTIVTTDGKLEDGSISIGGKKSKRKSKKAGKKSQKKQKKSKKAGSKKSKK